MNITVTESTGTGTGKKRTSRRIQKSVLLNRSPEERIQELVGVGNCRFFTVGRNGEALNRARLVADFLRENENMDRLPNERLTAVFFDSVFRPTGYAVFADGTASACVADIPSIMRASLLSGAAHIIAAHNHPTGNLNFSDSDRNTAAKLAAACGICGVGLADFITVSPFSGSDGYLSMQETGDLGKLKAGYADLGKASAEVADGLRGRRE